MYIPETTTTATAPASNGWGLSGALSGVLDAFNNGLSSVGDFKIKLAEAKRMNQEKLNDYWANQETAAKVSDPNPSFNPNRPTAKVQADYTKPILYGVGGLIAVAALVAVLKK